MSEVRIIRKTPEMEENKPDSKKEVEDVIGDLFYTSIKSFFDIGFKLAKNLNLEFLTKEENQKQDKEILLKYS